MEDATLDPAVLLKFTKTRMPFGKYKGRLLIDLPKPYVIWFANKGFPDGELAIKLGDESVDVVLMFDVFHSFCFPQAGDRSTLLGEISRIMKPSAFLSISVWPNLIETETEDELTNANFRLEKEVSKTLTSDNMDPERVKFLNFRKGQRNISKH